MNGEVCRAITLINYHIPYYPMDNDCPEYITIGFFDGMETRSIPLDYQKDDLAPLWDFSMHKMKYSAGNYSYQNIFVFGDNTWNTCTDTDFWAIERNKVYPLTFVVFLQQRDYVDSLEKLENRCRKLNDEIKRVMRDNGDAYTYYTIDKNDFVVCMKCINYRKAVEVIKNLHQVDGKVIYSYSVFSISKYILNEMTEGKYPDIYSQKLDSICLKGIANSYELTYHILPERRYREFCDKLMAKLYDLNDGETESKLYDILGDNDFRLIARQVNLGRLLAQFGNGGMLNYKEKEFRFVLFSSNLVFNTLTPELDDLGGEIPSNEKTKIWIEMDRGLNSSKCNELQKCLESKICKVIENEDYKNKAVEVTSLFSIWQLLQSMRSLEVAPTKKYDFCSLYDPLSSLIRILDKKENLADNEELYDFIYKISMTLHGTLRTDIQFFQMQDFNVIMHYAPAKLRAFYSLWAIKLTDFYRSFLKANTNTNTNYSFIFSPGMFKQVEVKQLYLNHSEKNRLMLITSPVRYLYSLRWTPVILAHEVSHFAGSLVRCREERHKVWLNCCARILAKEVNKFRYDSVQGDLDIKNNIADEMQQMKLYSKMEEILCHAEPVIRKKIGNENFSFHSDNSIYIIQKTFQYVTAYQDMRNVISADSSRLKKYLEEKLIKDKAFKCKEKTKVISRIVKATYSLDDNILMFIAKFQRDIINKILNILRYVTSEAYADLMAVLTLELSPDEYFLSFTDSILVKVQDGIRSLLLVRIALVITTIATLFGNPKKNFPLQNAFIENWSEKSPQNIISRMRPASPEAKLALMVFGYLEGIEKQEQIQNYVGIYERSSRTFSNSNLYFFKDRKIWHELCRYMNKCANQYMEILGANDTCCDKQKELENTYRRLREEKFSSAAVAIEQFLMEFEEKQQK